MYYFSNLFRKHKIKNSKLLGFSLIELLIALTIIAILSSISYPVYTKHVTHIRRIQAEIVLTDLAAHLEQYYETNNSYQNATLADLGVSEFTEGSYYKLTIDNSTENSFQISATPLLNQAKIDIDCGNLSLDQTGNKKISGIGKSDECWS